MMSDLTAGKRRAEGEGESVPACFDDCNLMELVCLSAFVTLLFHDVIPFYVPEYEPPSDPASSHLT